MRYGLGTIATLVMAIWVSGMVCAAEGETVKAQTHEYGVIYVRPAGSQDEVKTAKQEYQVHGNAMSMAINQRGIVRANVAVKEGGRVMLRNAGNVGSNSVVVGRRFADPVQVAKGGTKTGEKVSVVAAE